VNVESITSSLFDIPTINKTETKKQSKFGIDIGPGIGIGLNGSIVPTLGFTLGYRLYDF